MPPLQKSVKIGIIMSSMSTEANIGVPNDKIMKVMHTEPSIVVLYWMLSKFDKEGPVPTKELGEFSEGN
jgi:hypothetical protein